MTAKAELIEAIVDAIEEVEGLRAVAPFGLEAVTRLPRGGRAYAVELGPELVEIRLAASSLPLQPLLDRLTAAVRALLRSTEWADATVRLIVAELDASAFGEYSVT
ncbi:hypothetical protein [Nocardia inohanensis]|uniref:hypothetical protein n=1 Tax=Nocardia inohanensis TaxID=209246 RepID=UPI00082C7635|nr:hypothetical protein [Nocardia inohanensis]